jgi:zinc/manganese transport system substrate-binding protein
MLRTKLALAAVGPFFLVLGASSLAAAKTLEIAASFTVLADVVAEVGGTHVAVHGLVGPNGDPHAYEPSPTDARLLRSADLVFVSGDGLEGWMDRHINASGYQGTP